MRPSLNFVPWAPLFLAEQTSTGVWGHAGTSVYARLVSAGTSVMGGPIHARLSSQSPTKQGREYVRLGFPDAQQP